VSARVSIYDIGVGEGVTAFESTRFIRWMTHQRSEMMSIEPEEIGAEEVCLFTPDCFPMGGRLDLELLRKITDEAPMAMGQARSEGGQYCLQVLKPARYHISADVNVSDRKNTAIIRFETRDERDAAMAVIVSGAFFWYWRCHGNGMQLRMKEIDGFPWPQSGVRELAEVGRSLAQMLDEEVFQVRSKNKGEYTSAAFRGGLDLIDEADSIITNSLVGDKVDYSGFFASTRYPDAKYSSSVPYKLGRKMRHTTPKGERDAVYRLIKDRLKGLADSESRTMSMQEMYDYIVEEHSDPSSGFELSEIQLSMHRQRTGPIEEHFKHDLKNSLSNGKRLGEVISPASDSWGRPRPADWMNDVVDPVEWEGFVQNAKDHLPSSNKKFEIVAVRGDEILVKRPKKGGRTHSITRSLVNSKTLHLMKCGGDMEASSMHAYVDMREALIALHPRIDFLRSNPKRIRFLRKSG
jgi:hypothetical protein